MAAQSDSDRANPDRSNPDRSNSDQPGSDPSESSRRPIRGYHALVLAGRRGPDDPLARAANAPHRAMLDVGGQPMLERVLQTLIETPCIGDIEINIDVPELIQTFPGLKAMIADARGHIVVTKSASSPSRSVLSSLDDGSPEQPLLVTTADHALLTVEMVEHFLAESEELGGDVTVALVPRTLLQARFPNAQRTYLPFAGERYSGANLFAFLTPRAQRAAEFWTRAESFRKRPWRLVATFGPVALLLFLTRRLDLRAAFERVSSTIGVRVSPIEMPQAEAAIDVDKIADWELVREIVEQRSLAEAAEPSSEPDAAAEGNPEAPDSAQLDPRDTATSAASSATDQSARSPSATKPPLSAS